MARRGVIPKFVLADTQTGMTTVHYEHYEGVMPCGVGHSGELSDWFNQFTTPPAGYGRRANLSRDSVKI